MASKILFYRLKYKFLIINYIYMLHRQVGYCNQLQRIRTNYNEVADFQRLFYLPKIQL